MCASKSEHSPPLAVSMGDPAGLGLDLFLGLYTRPETNLPPAVLIADPDLVSERAEKLGRSSALERFTIAPPATSLPASPVIAGKPDPATAPAIADAIAQAVELCQTEHASAVVTLPIAKSVMAEGGFAFPGHTEYLGELAGGSVAPVMMLACPGLRVVPVTVHTALASVSGLLSTEAIIHAGRTAASALQKDFGITTPRLAIAGLNPHAGEDGRMGDEEARIIVPAIKALQADGIDASGPHPADTLFHANARKDYDAALCMYHDQALIPLKTIDFFRGVNITLGLPFVRTSPDHGTAFSLAGTGQGDPTSLHEALKTAWSMAQFRRASTP